MRIALPALAAACALLPLPALAAEPEAEAARVAEELSDPVRQQRMVIAAEAMSEAVLAMPVAPLMRAAATIAGEDPDYVDPDLRVGDIAGPEAAAAPREFAYRMPQMMGAMAGLAAAFSQMMPEFRELGSRIEDAVPRDYERDYDYYDYGY